MLIDRRPALRIPRTCTRPHTVTGAVRPFTGPRAHDSTRRSRRRSTSLPEARVTTTSHQVCTRPDPSTLQQCTVTTVHARERLFASHGRRIHHLRLHRLAGKSSHTAHAHTRTRARGESPLRSSTSVALHQRDAAPWALQMSDDPPACFQMSDDPPACFQMSDDPPAC